MAPWKPGSQNNHRVNHNNYFDGKIQSLRFHGESGDASVGVITPGEYSFTTDSAEHVEILSGSLEFRMQQVRRQVAAGASYDVPPGVTFTVACSRPVSYICYFRAVADETEARLTLPPILERTATLIQAIIDGFAPEDLDWRPSPGRWSARMVIAHLAEAEVNCFRARLARAALAGEECPLLPDYDQGALFQSGAMSGKDQTLESFRREREISLEFLRTLPAAVLARRCRHEKLGILTFEELLNEYAFHDMGHMRQILELCRAGQFYPKMGAWRDYYRVDP
jgi:purine/pyrimidine-nucleoside phosphorylase